MQRSLNIINQYLETPIDLEGKKPAELFKKKRRRRTTRRKQAESDAEEDEHAEFRQTKRKEKRKKEKQQYKSAEFIVDSDAEMGDMDDFLAREKALREKTAALAAATGQVATMRAHGTRKRRRKGKEEKDKRKRRRRAEEDGAGEDDDEGGGEAGLEGEKDAEKERDGSESETSELDVFGSPKGGTPVASPPPDTDTAPNRNRSLARDLVPKWRNHPQNRMLRRSLGLLPLRRRMCLARSIHPRFLRMESYPRRRLFEG